MIPSRKSVIGAIALSIALASSFALGHWSGGLEASLKREASYPWALHRELSNIDARCEKLRAPATIGKFFVEPTDGGETLLVAVLNDRAGLVNAFAVSSSGQVASDSWPVECEQK